MPDAYGWWLQWQWTPSDEINKNNCFEILTVSINATQKSQNCS